MKFGLHLFGMHRTDRPADESFESVVEQVRLARDAGFDLIWAGHHYLVEGNAKFQVVPTVARVAADAGEMHVGTSVILPLHHPVELAEQFATLDAITGGRAILGAVAGYRDAEFDAFGVPKAERAGRLTEGVEVIRRLWTEDGASYDGEHVSLSDATITPKPVQEPRPPIWVGANADRAVERASRIGDAWLVNPHEDAATIERQMAFAAPPSGSGFRGVQPARRDAFVAETDQAALEAYGPHVAAYYGWYRDVGQGEAMENPDALDLPFEKLREDRFIVGSPETVTEGLVRLHERTGIDCVLLGMHRPGVAREDLRRSIRLTGEEVIPAVRERIGDG